MRPNIDDHDYDVKMRKVFEFLEEGDKVKVTMRFRGREMAHNQLGMAVLQRVAADTEKVAKIEAASAHGRPPDADGHRAEVTSNQSGSDGRRFPLRKSPPVFVAPQHVTFSPQPALFASAAWRIRFPVSPRM